jgi:hypothetical protein
MSSFAYLGLHYHRVRRLPAAQRRFPGGFSSTSYADEMPISFVHTEKTR